MLKIVGVFSPIEMMRLYVFKDNKLESQETPMDTQEILQAIDHYQPDEFTVIGPRVYTEHFVETIERHALSTYTEKKLKVIFG